MVMGNDSRKIQWAPNHLDDELGMDSLVWSVENQANPNTQKVVNDSGGGVQAVMVNGGGQVLLLKQTCNYKIIKPSSIISL